MLLSPALSFRYLLPLISPSFLIPLPFPFPSLHSFPSPHLHSPHRLPLAPSIPSPSPQVPPSLPPSHLHNGAESRSRSERQPGRVRSRDGGGRAGARTAVAFGGSGRRRRRRRLSVVIHHPSSSIPIDTNIHHAFTSLPKLMHFILNLPFTAMIYR